MPHCRTCEAARLARTESKKVTPDVRPARTVCSNAGATQGAFSTDDRVALGTLLAEPVGRVKPGEKGTFRLLDFVAGSPVPFARFQEVEAVWCSSEPCDVGDLAELVFFDAACPMSGLHATLAERASGDPGADGCGRTGCGCAPATADEGDARGE